jgi:Arc/MetJ-type ribon-helix-helix transcriptional regulator
MLRLNQETMDQIDALVTSGRFKDRVDVVRTAVERMLHGDRDRDDLRAEMRQLFEEMFLKGELDGPVGTLVRQELADLGNSHRDEK